MAEIIQDRTMRTHNCIYLVWSVLHLSGNVLQSGHFQSSLMSLRRDQQIADKLALSFFFPVHSESFNNDSSPLGGYITFLRSIVKIQLILWLQCNNICVADVIQSAEPKEFANHPAAYLACFPLLYVTVFRCPSPPSLCLLIFYNCPPILDESGVLQSAV